MLLLASGCVASRIERMHGYTPNPANPPRFDSNAVEEYFFLSWEPYLFICTLGIIPQYHEVVYEIEPGVYEKHATMVGWLAMPLPLVSSWEYGQIADEDKPGGATSNVDAHEERQPQPKQAG